VTRAGLVLGLLLAVSAPASAATSCSLSGPAGTYRALPLHVDQPGTTLNMSIDAAYSRTGLTRASWHLAAGLIVIDRKTTTPIAFVVSNDGQSPRRAVLQAGGQEPTVVDLPGPGVPLHYENRVPGPGLAVGDYVVVAFGSDGSGADPVSAPPMWRASLQLDGTHACTSTGNGSVFDFDQSAFRGGTLVAAGSALVADGAQLSATFGRQLVVGLMDAHGGPGGSAELAYRHPSASGTVADDITAFASRGGAFSWTATATGALASVDIAGVALDLPTN
jgi:hypothetical protein